MENVTISQLEEAIQKAAQRSQRAPAAFLVPELRRSLSRDLAYGFKTSIRDVDTFLPYLEREYLCYFQRKDFVLEMGNRRSHWWQFVYAGCNSQIEGFLLKEGLSDTLEKLGFGGVFEPVERISKYALARPLRKYLIGIGYLYPDGDEVIVHPNMLYAQLGGHLFGSGDSTFLTRDIIRCPYHFHEQLGEREMWSYWNDLVCLSAGRLPEYELYRPEQFRGHEHNKLIKSHLGYGRKFVPRRFLELQPALESYDSITAGLNIRK